MKHWFLMIGVILFTLNATKEVYADRRIYVWTYEYMTMPAGLAEIEYYNTVQLPDKGHAEVNTWQHWLEIEYGLTNYWDISLYQQFKQTNKTNNASFEYDGFKLRTRYRLGEMGDYLFDPLIYLEYIRSDDLSKPGILEGKLILAKDMGRFNMSANLILEKELSGSSETELGYAAGTSFELSPSLKIGLESKGGEQKYYLGPVIALSANKLWLSFSTILGLTAESDDLQARMIMGLPF